MALANKTRLIAAATLAALAAPAAVLAAAPATAQSGGRQSGPLQLAAEKMGKEIRVEDVLKGRKRGQSGEAGKTAGSAPQTARQPAQSGGGDDSAFGVERPAPEGKDPNEVIGGGDGAERPLDGGGQKGGSTAKSAGGNKAGGANKNTSGDNGDGDDLPPGDI